jgi:CubicO group peptidase (beta-lactamase class C family)
MAVLTDKVDSLFSEWDKPDSPGCAIAIIQGGEVIYSRGYGMADLDHAIPISTNSVFDIGSTSKQFTAMCVALLARQGKFSLDDEIQTYLPEIRHYEHPTTIRHLIHHTSGLRDYLALMDLAGWRFENDYPDDELISLIARQKELNFQPGEEFLYSNTGYLLLAEIIKRVSGLSLRAFADEAIFAPLGMKNTHFHDDFSEIVKHRAVGYSPKDSGGYRIDMSLFDVVGDGGVYTTVEDLCLWDANFYHNVVGGCGQDLIEEIITPGRLNSGEALDYAFGLRVGPYRGLRMIAHSGRWMGYRAQMIRFPEQRFTVICLANLKSIDPTDLARQIADIYLAEEFTEPEKTSPGEPPAAELSTSEMEDKLGFYRGVKSGVIWEFTMQDGKLIAEFGGMSFQIAPTEPGRYKSVGALFDIRIELESHGPPNPIMMSIQIDGDKVDVLERVRSASLDIERLMDYSGDYYCAELDVTYRLRIENDELILGRRNSPQEHLKPVSHDLFKGTRTSFEFARNAQSQITGFDLGAGRVRNIRFIKQRQ